MTALNDFFRPWLRSLQSNTDFRENLNKQANHTLDISVENLEKQLKFLESEAIKEYSGSAQQFQKDISSLVRDLKSKEVQQTVSELKEQRSTFSGIRVGFRQKFFDQISSSNLDLLKKLGVDIGHVKANLTIASERKALEEFEKVTTNISEYGSPLSGKDIEEISKVLALTEVYIGLLRQLDEIQTPKQLEAFLRNKNAISGLSGRKKSFKSLQELKSYISAGAGAGTGAKPYADIGRNLLQNTVFSAEISSSFNIIKSLDATTDDVSTTIEVSSFNQFKGTIAKEVKNAYIKVLDTSLSRGTIAKPDDNVSQKLDAGLLKIIGNSFSKETVLKIFKNVRASKTHEEALVDIIFSPITGKNKKYTSKSKKEKGSTKNNTKIKLKPLALNVKKVVLPKIPIRDTKSLTNLPNLLLQINGLLKQQIRKNMGTGGSTDILNYRSGRFTEGVKVERLSESREGMITAFYSYMKNPYATFSQGGRQALPASRDPKLLIAKSIRELAQTMVTNRLRAVNV